MPLINRPGNFWREVIALKDSATPQVLHRVLIFGAFAALVYALDHAMGHRPELEIGLTTYEVLGAALALLLVLRTNSGYERWWEGRKLWGGIVNQCRHLAVVALAYGPDDPAWRPRLVRRTAALAHVMRRSLRGEREMPEVSALLGADEARRIGAARHMPTAMARAIADDLRMACDRGGMDRFALHRADTDLGMLLDHIGGCERILKTPLARAYTIQMRRFIVLFLGTLPFGLIPKIGWLTPIVTMIVAYPVLSLDKIGEELQNPFSVENLNHLPLDAICHAIQDELLEMLPPAALPADGSIGEEMGTEDNSL